MASEVFSARTTACVSATMILAIRPPATGNGVDVSVHRAFIVCENGHKMAAGLRRDPSGIGSQLLDAVWQLRAKG